MEEDRLALELLKELKSISKRWFILFIITLILLFATNIAWLYAWNLPDSSTSQSYDIEAQDNGDAIYNNSGEVNLDGEN